MSVRLEPGDAIDCGPGFDRYDAPNDEPVTANFEKELDFLSTNQHER